MIHVFLDDLRMTPAKYTHVFRTAKDLIEWLDTGVEHIDELSLDHDLGLNIMDGYDLVKVLQDYPDLSINYIQFHTSNFEGLKNM